jgi:hydrogenase maturation protease
VVEARVADRTLVAGIGNIFLGDDGFGCEVVRRLAGSAVPAGVRVVDYGIRGMHLAYDLIEGWDRLILVDALPDRGSPGQVETLEIGLEHLAVEGTGEPAPQAAVVLEGEAVPAAGGLDAHGMGPDAVLSSLAALGGRLPPTILVGVQVSDIGEQMGLSAAVAAAVPAAVDAIQSLLGRPDQSGTQRWGPLPAEVR